MTGEGLGVTVEKLVVGAGAGVDDTHGNSSSSMPSVSSSTSAARAAYKLAAEDDALTLAKMRKSRPLGRTLREVEASQGRKRFHEYQPSS